MPPPLPPRTSLSPPEPLVINLCEVGGVHLESNNIEAPVISGLDILYVLSTYCAHLQMPPKMVATIEGLAAKVLAGFESGLGTT